MLSRISTVALICFGVLAVVSCANEGASPEVSLPTKDDAEVVSATVGSADDLDDDDFFPIRGVIPSGEIEAENLVHTDAGLEYRRLMQINGSAEQYFAQFTTRAEAAGFAVESATDDRREYVLGEHQIVVTALPLAGTTNSSKIHVVWLAR